MAQRDSVSVAPGDTGNSDIDGHRDTHFSLLRNLKVGDRLQVETLARGHVRFHVTNVSIVDSRRARVSLDADSPRLTLVTCYPFDAVVPGGPLRWVVTAGRRVQREKARNLLQMMRENDSSDCRNAV